MYAIKLARIKLEGLICHLTIEVKVNRLNFSHFVTIKMSSSFFLFLVKKKKKNELKRTSLSIVRYTSRNLNKIMESRSEMTIKGVKMLAYFLKGESKNNFKQ